MSNCSHNINIFESRGDNAIIVGAPAPFTRVCNHGAVEIHLLRLVVPTPLQKGRVVW